ncbi:MAG: hypothetical protein ACREGG_02090 [Candidatus Saccharimonadales bacterium]
MLLISRHGSDPTPSADSCRFLCRRLGGKLGVAPDNFVRLWNTRTPDGDLPLLALDLTPFEHLCAANAVTKAKEIIDEYASRLQTVQRAARKRRRRQKRQTIKRPPVFRPPHHALVA